MLQKASAPNPLFWETINQVVLRVRLESQIRFSVRTFGYPWLHQLYTSRASDNILMPVTPARTKKALQELAKVFNKLASELTADLNSAINEIDTLKREVQRLKSGQGKTNKTSSFQKKSSGSKTKSHTKGTPSGTSHTGTHHTHEATPDIKPSGEFVFPHEPFNPSPPPEPAPPGNN